MPNRFHRFHRAAARIGTAFSVAALLVASPIVAHTEPAAEPVVTSVGTLAPALNVGDVVFIRVAARPFREVAAATDSWTNHVGIVTGNGGGRHGRRRRTSAAMAYGGATERRTESGLAEIGRAHV